MYVGGFAIQGLSQPSQEYHTLIFFVSRYSFSTD